MGQVEEQQACRGSFALQALAMVATVVGALEVTPQDMAQEVGLELVP
jgi:hypothetical protein